MGVTINFLSFAFRSDWKNSLGKNFRFVNFFIRRIIPDSSLQTQYPLFSFSSRGHLYGLAYVMCRSFGFWGPEVLEVYKTLKNEFWRPKGRTFLKKRCKIWEKCMHCQVTIFPMFYCTVKVRFWRQIFAWHMQSFWNRETWVLPHSLKPLLLPRRARLLAWKLTSISITFIGI